MKHFLLAAAALTMSMGLSAAGLGDIKTVYLLPMSSGLDQYLAQRLTAEAVLQVVKQAKPANLESVAQNDLNLLRQTSCDRRMP